MTFVINSDNNITALGSQDAGSARGETFHTQEELAQLAAKWPPSRGLEQHPRPDANEEAKGREGGHRQPMERRSGLCPRRSPPPREALVFSCPALV